jgi:hypothetical protein
MSGSDDSKIIVWNTAEWYALENSKIRTITPHKILEDEKGHEQCKFTF